MTVTTYPLSSLRLSPVNVRKRKPSGIASLAADIAAHGLLQNLVGYEAEGKVLICAGGRRYRALKRLQKDKQITATFEVPVDIRSINEALELSLAENVQREAMHPADAIMAYRALIEGGMDETDIAARFGVSVDHVRRLLRLSGLHPKLITELRQDRLSIAGAQALALSDDQQEQWQVYKQAGDNPHYLKAILTEEKLATTSPLFTLVGIDAYEEAGGTLTRDLFAEEHYADNPALIYQLATIRLEELAEGERMNGWGTVIASLERPDNFYCLSTLYPDATRELTQDEQAELTKLEEQLATMDTDEVPYHDKRRRELKRAKHRIEQGQHIHSAKQKASATLYLFIAHDGLTYHAVGQPKKEKKAATPRPDYPAALLTDLGAIRTLALREAVAKDSALALDILLDCMLGQLLGDSYSFEQALELRLTESTVDAKPELVEGCTIEPIAEAVSDILPQLQSDDRLAAISALSQTDKLRLLAFCTASQITSSDLAGVKSEAIAAVAARAGLNMPERWTPPVAFYQRLTKPVLLKLLQEHCGAEAAMNCQCMKKVDLAAVCAERLNQAGYYPLCLISADVTEEVEVANAA